MNNSCNICTSSLQSVFTTKVLNKYDVDYFKCVSCGFIQTEKPFWLNEAYTSAITSLDIGLLYRNLIFVDIVEEIVLKNLFNANGKFIDYGGGYGVFVRLMRDKGFDYYRQDIYCENLFAKHFDIEDLQKKNEFELLTAFEVFEHLENPIIELEKMLSYSDNIIFSTELTPNDNPTPDTWWYFAPETGQHISLYSLKSLQFLAGKFKLHFYSNGATMHIFTKSKLASDPFAKPIKKRGIEKYWAKLKPKEIIKKRDSLLMKDFEFIKKLINK